MKSPYSPNLSSQCKTLICELACRLEGGSFGSFTPSIYDTAWVAMIHKPGGDFTCLFPQCFDHLLRFQNEEGGWAASASVVDGILNTLAALIALKKYQRSNSSFCLPGDLETRISKADRFARTLLTKWDVSSTDHVAFEILVPSLLRILEDDSERFEFPGRQTLFDLNASKLVKFSPELLYGTQTSTLVHSLEAFVGKVDFDKVGHHLNERGSMWASPSSTAAFLIHSSEWNKSAESYLQNVVALGKGINKGGVPTFFPSSIFELAWTVSTMRKATNDDENVLSEDLVKIGRFLQSTLNLQNGVIGTDIGIPADADDTAKVVLALNLLGFPTSPERLIADFENSTHFRTFKQESNASLSTNCNVLDALLHSPNPGRYVKSISKAAEYLCDAWYSGQIKDKWNLSKFYPMMLMCQAFVKLLQTWDNGQLSSLRDELIHTRIPLTLFQAMVATLECQSADGSWGLGPPSREITAYAMLLLKALLTIPWLTHFAAKIDQAISWGSAYLISTYKQWGADEYIWIGKTSYALPPVSQAYCLAALCTSTSHTWSEQIKQLAVLPFNKITKLSNFFAKLPIFSNDERWVLEAAVVEGFFWLPQLIRIRSDIFPCEDVRKYKYLEYIPFTWIITNRRNATPLSNNVLWELMSTALLQHQLDDYMESVVCSKGQLKDIKSVKSLVKRLCAYPGDHETEDAENQYNITNGGPSRKSSTNGVSANNFTADGARLDNPEERVNNISCEEATDNFSSTQKYIKRTLNRFTSHILNHPTVVQSPSHIRLRLHQQLERYILAHIAHEEANTRFAFEHQPEVRLPDNTDSQSHPQIKPFLTPLADYYTWTTTISAQDIGSSFMYHLFTILASPNPSQPFFQGAKQHWFSARLDHHLAIMCRQYNDYGSLARDVVEGNLNSLNFLEFHEAPSRGETAAMKADLFAIAEFERESLDHAMAKLDAEVRRTEKGVWKMNALRAYVDTVDLYGQLYVARDISPRVK